MEEKQYISLEFLVWTETRQIDTLPTDEPIYNTHTSIRIDDLDLDEMTGEELKEYIINQLMERI